MDIPWGSAASQKFVTNVGLITSNGPLGHNVMAAEWTHHISYSPGFIAINIHEKDVTAHNILKSGEFGVNLASAKQSVLSSIAGGYTGREVDKIAVLNRLSVKFYKARKINVLMIKGATLNLECRFVFEKKLGDHIMFVGEVVEMKVNEDIEPLAYHGGKYWKLGENIKKPLQIVLDRIARLVDKHKKPKNND